MRARSIVLGVSGRIGGDRTQLDVGLFEQFLNPVRDPILLLSQFRTIPCEVTQILDLRRWHETALQQSVLQQVGNPLAVLRVGLSAGHRLHVLRIR
jgi:hypothetical protein